MYENAECRSDAVSQRRDAWVASLRDRWSVHPGHLLEWLCDTLHRTLLVLDADDAKSMDRAVALRQLLALVGDSVCPEETGLCTCLHGTDEHHLLLVGIERSGGTASRTLLRANPRVWSARPDLSPGIFELTPEKRRTPWDPLPADAFWRRQLGEGRPCTYRGVTNRTAVRTGILAPDRGVVLISLPTGAGKSLCALVPAAERLSLRGGPRRGTAVMVVPTLALMSDQQRSIQRDFDLGPGDVRTLSGSDDPSTRLETLRALEGGEMAFILMPPEIAMGQGRTALESCAKRGRLAALIIDEAHLITTWGAGFRPAFQRMGELRRRLADDCPSMTTLLLSATATDEAERRLRKFFAGDDPWCHVDGRALRQEHETVVCIFDDAGRRREALLELIALIPRPAIVYATERDEAREIFNALRLQYERVELFTGETGAVERERIIREWNDDRIDLVVATSAFGLGVDKADVRAVVHAQLPESLDRFYQEVGRGGRDGFACLSVALVVQSDIPLARGLVQKTLASSEIAADRWIAMREESCEVATPLGGRGFQVDLTTRSDRVKAQAEASGKLNRSWNESVLLLLERAEAITVESVDTDIDRRVVSIRQQWALSGDAEEVTASVELRRSEEQKRNKGLLDQLERVFASDPERCLDHELASCYGLGSTWVECGRCEYCRRRGVDPGMGMPRPRVSASWESPRVPRRASGRTAPWERCSAVRVRLDASHTTPQHRRSIVRHLAHAGCEQFLLPHACLDEVVDVLAADGTDAGLGLVNMLTRDLRGADLERVPTAVWLDGIGASAAAGLAERLPSEHGGLLIWLCPSSLSTYSGGSVWDLLRADRSWTWRELSGLLAR